jgi:predicted pyridoxine 5'-phosphate oxidase superfamily flavin-nucleotide-binding protein
MSFGKLTFTPLVKKLQELYGSRAQYARMDKSAEPQVRFSDFEKEFLAGRDMFYWATTSVTGWPYVQYRGGPKGFLKVIDDQTLAFADFRGNRQYITTGNLMSDDRVALILVDYPRQARLKILAHVEIFEGGKAESWLARVRMPDYKAVIERVFVIHVEAYDWNCPQHIIPRYTAAEIRDAAHSIEEESRRLWTENESLRKEIALLRSNQGDPLKSTKKGTQQ